ncbi:hypothetical protein J5J10_17120 [Ciceribacter sp. L1K23]|uniref:hypothetical protein n=1 Tax=unclassified Ciceribacter TaxID=2628820 RepID=UPI001ABE2C7D|nr:MULTISPECIES: hypothetical protein [unclassified Ciceribacter]MBO3758635.1 hypothetical protein [Ciceribacter sp. L1K22]MBR0557412.1 hypothetical protein [Ciceribacter sp. L1K23]
MTYDPNMTNRPDLQPTPQPPRGPSWTPWIAVAAVLLLGVVVWSLMSAPGTDPATTSSTTPPAVTETAPSAEPVDPVAPATPPATETAPSTTTPSTTTP